MRLIRCPSLRRRLSTAPVAMEKLVDEDLPQPGLVTLGAPSSVEDKEAIDLGGGKSVDDVGGVTLAQLGVEGAGTSEGAGDASLALVALPGDLGEQTSGFLVGPGGVGEDAVDRAASAHEVAEQGGEARQLVERVWVGEEGADLWAVEHGNRLVVAGDREVEDGLEDAELRGEQPVHRRLG